MARAWFFLVLLNSSSFSEPACQFLVSLVQVQVGHGEPCFPPSPKLPQLLPMQPGALLFLAPICDAVYPNHE